MSKICLKFNIEINYPLWGFCFVSVNHILLLFKFLYQVQFVWCNGCNLLCGTAKREQFFPRCLDRQKSHQSIKFSKPHTVSKRNLATEFIWPSLYHTILMERTKKRTSQRPLILWNKCLLPFLAPAVNCFYKMLTTEMELS